MKPIIKKIEVHHIYDENPFLDYLDQFENSVNPDEQKYFIEDQKRKSLYGLTWYCIGIKAVAIVYLPFEVITNNGKTINYKLQKIDSSGLWGIESDSEQTYIKEFEHAQIEELKTWLSMLNVDPEGINFEEYETIKI